MGLLEVFYEVLGGTLRMLGMFNVLQGTIWVLEVL